MRGCTQYLQENFVVHTGIEKKRKDKKKKLEGVEFTVTVLIRTFLTHNIYIYLASLPFAINVFFNLI